MKRLISFATTLFLLSSTVYAAPDRTMSIAPVAVSGDTITASDENSRNNEVADKFNNHTHADVSTLSTNVFTIGDNAVGNKTYAVDTDQAANPGLRYNTTIDLWTLSNDGSTYRAVAHADTNNGFTSGAMLYGGSTSGAILSAGNATNGQILIGQASGAPLIGNITGSGGAVVTNGAGTIDINAAALGTPALTLGTSNSAGVATTAIRTDATVAAFDSTTPAAVGATGATGSAAVAARRDHVHASNGAWAFVETLAPGAVTTITTATLPTDSDLFLVVFENVRGAASAELLFQFNAVVTNYKYNFVEGTTWAAITAATAVKLGDFGGGSAASINGTMLVPRLSENSFMAFDINVPYTSDDGSDTPGKTILGGHAGASTITTMTFSSASNFTGGKIHIYKSIPS